MRVVLCNCPPEAAADIARALVDKRLAACVNLIPGVRSIYRWKGEICDDGETTLLIKTTATDLAPLRTALIELHPYEVPEILALPIDAAASHGPYLDWMRQHSG